MNHPAYETLAWQFHPTIPFSQHILHRRWTKVKFSPRSICCWFLGKSRIREFCGVRWWSPQGRREPEWARGGYQVKTPFVRPLRHKETKFPWFPNCVVYLSRVHYVIISDNPYLPAAVDGTLHFRGRWARTPRWQTPTCLVYGCPRTDDLTTHLCLKISLLLELLL